MFPFYGDILYEYFVCYIIAFDLGIIKSVLANPQMKIIDPWNYHGALRSECSFDGVKFKRIIVVQRIVHGKTKT